VAALRAEVSRAMAALHEAKEEVAVMQEQLVGGGHGQARPNHCTATAECLSFRILSLRAQHADAHAPPACLPQLPTDSVVVSFHWSHSGGRGGSACCPEQGAGHAEGGERPAAARAGPPGGESHFFNGG
jgi:hypothetical protein